ncbi:CLUMA_CG009553, isoform A [Clunio marinus]|uniref:CLUMA_CG009553, isoform A n=1 Tax=Clunio marinus TaxID=568069 RepID=A0A1J1I7G7_9DIPT|nr:CLUMA_CG009553, isoform A [Clunio marinus]
MSGDDSTIYAQQRKKLQLKRFLKDIFNPIHPRILTFDLDTINNESEFLRLIVSSIAQKSLNKITISEKVLWAIMMNNTLNYTFYCQWQYLSNKI